MRIGISATDLVRLGVDHGDRIVGPRSKRNAIRRRQHAGGAAAAVATFSERQAGSHKRLHASARRDSSRLTIASEFDSLTFGSPRPGTCDLAASRSPASRRRPPPATGNRTRETAVPFPSRCFRSAPGTRLVFEHPDVGDVGALPVRRKRHRKRQPAQPQDASDCAAVGIDCHQSEIRLIEHVEQPAVGIEGQVAGEAVVRSRPD